MKLMKATKSVCEKERGREGGRERERERGGVGGWGMKPASKIVHIVKFKVRDQKLNVSKQKHPHPHPHMHTTLTRPDKTA